MRWLDKQRIRPKIVGEFDDSALLKAFGQGGAGLRRRTPRPGALDRPSLDAPVVAVAFSADGRYLFAASAASEFSVFDCADLRYPS